MGKKSEEKKQREKIEIVWENADMLVLNKPAGVVVNRAESVKGETVQDWVEKYLELKEKPPEGEDREGEDWKLFEKRSGLAHRLDKETSGCLLVAKNPRALIHLLTQFKSRQTKKEYLALVHGRLEPKEGTIRLPLRRSLRDRRRQEVSYEGKIAQTSWKVERYLVSRGGEWLSLVWVYPKTGRMHQIRVHLAHMGWPIFADEKYLNKAKRREDRKWLRHHFLHAARIGFEDMNGKWHEVEAELPRENQRLIDPE